MVIVILQVCEGLDCTIHGLTTNRYAPKNDHQMRAGRRVMHAVNALASLFPVSANFHAAPASRFIARLCRQDLPLESGVLSFTMQCH